MEIRWTYVYWNKVLSLIPRNARTLLDVGTGKGIVGALSKVFLSDMRVVGVEIFEPYVQSAENLYSGGIIHGDAVDILTSMPGKSFDVITCFDCIEHQRRDEALYMMREMERVGKLVMISSVNWFFEQPEYDGNPWQRHRCLMRSLELETQHGYKTLGFGKQEQRFGWLFRKPLRHFCSGYLAWKDCSQ